MKRFKKVYADGGPKPRISKHSITNLFKNITDFSRNEPVDKIEGKRIQPLSLKPRMTPDTTDAVAGLNANIGTGTKFNFESAANAVAPFMSNIANAFKKPPKPTAPQQVSPITIPKISFDNQRNQVRRAGRTQDMAADRSLDANSAAAVRSANLGTTINALNQVNESESNTNANLQMQGAGINASIDAMNTGARNQYQDQRTARDIAHQREQSENLANSVDKHIGIQNEKRKGALDLEKWKIMQANDPDGVLKRFIEKMKKEGITDPTGVMKQMGAMGGVLRRVKDSRGFTHPVTLADGGMLNGDPVDPKPRQKVFTSQAEITAANQELRTQLARQKAPKYFVENSVVANKIGDPYPIFQADPNKAGANVPKANTLPFGVTVDDVVNTQSGHGYYHPQNGNFVPVDANSIYAQYKPKIPVKASDSASLVKMRAGGMMKNRLKKLRKVYEDGGPIDPKIH